MLRSLPAPLEAIVVAGLIATPGLAETAEEAVAYVFMGLADGAEIDRGPTHITWRAGSSSPAVFFGHGEAPDRAYDVTFTVTALSPCRYEVHLAGPPEIVPGGTALYARILLDDITEVTPDDDRVAINGDGFCQTSDSNPNCLRGSNTDVFGAIDPIKHTRLFEHLQRNFCVRIE
jgi:hypothetical protein